MSFIRHPKTTNEKRQSADPEVMEFIRPDRQTHNLVDAWDDNFRDTERSWKAHRMTQYREEK